MLDHIGEEGCDKEFASNCNNDSGTNLTCSMILNPYVIAKNGSVLGVWDIGINSKNSNYKWGDKITFKSSDIKGTTSSTSDPSYCTIEYYDNTSGFGNKYARIGLILNIFDNYKYNNFIKVLPYFTNKNKDKGYNIDIADENYQYPSAPSKYPWSMMFCILDLHNKLYIHYYDKNNSKKCYRKFVCRTTASVQTFCRFTKQNRDSQSFSVGETIRINNTLSKDKGCDILSRIRIFNTFKPMQNRNNTTVDYYIWGGGLKNKDDLEAETAKKEEQKAYNERLTRFNNALINIKYKLSKVTNHHKEYLTTKSYNFNNNIGVVKYTVKDLNNTAEFDYYTEGKHTYTDVVINLDDGTLVDDYDIKYIESDNDTDSDGNPLGRYIYHNITVKPEYDC